MCADELRQEPGTEEELHTDAETTAGTAAAAEAEAAGGESGSEVAQAAAAAPPALPDERTELLAATKSRVTEVLSATDRAAESILEAARAEADAYLRETHERVERLSKTRIERLATVTEDLLGHADRVRSDVESLREALQNATTALASELGAPSAAASANGASGLRAQEADAPPAGKVEIPAPAAYDGSERELRDHAGTAADEQGADEGEGESRTPFRRRFRRARQATSPNDPIEILVLQMLASGADRDAIGERLRDEFGVEEPDELLASLGIVARQA